MSLSDHLRFLRAMRGGPSLVEVCAAIGEPSGARVRAIELHYRDVSDDEIIERLAAYYAVPAAELQWHRARSRRALALHVHAAMQANREVTLHLRSRETLRGQPVWWDLAAIGLQPEGGGPLLVVQRHAVIDWEGS